MSNDNINYVRLHHSVTGEWYWRAVGHNGRVVAQHGGYNDEDNAREGIRLNYGDVEVRVVE